MAGEREEFLKELESMMSGSGAYSIARGHGSDLTIRSNPVHSQWCNGTAHEDYRASLTVVEHEGMVHLWESVRGHGATSPSQHWGDGAHAVIAQVAARHGLGVRNVIRRRAAGW